MCIKILVNQAVTSKKFEINLIFLSSRFATRLKSQDKKLNSLRTKRAFEVK